MIGNKFKGLGSTIVRRLVNDIPTQLINTSYNAYSRIQRGQMNLGLPVSRELLLSQEEIRNGAVGKLALSLYHMFINATGLHIPRKEIKLVIDEELEKGNLRLTEKVILLTADELTHLSLKRFRIPKKHLANILDLAKRRRILKEAIRTDAFPIYFESEIEERETNGRGNYETVYYRDFTDQGKEICFRRLVSMEAVTTGDSRPSMIMIPGFANNSNCFNLTNQYSLAKDMADRGNWVYLFDPRGVGVNEGRFDPLYTVDTLIDYDLLTVLRFIYSRSCNKPAILMGHSMGGLVAENMVLNWSLRNHLNDVGHLTAEQREALDRVLPPLEEAQHYLKMVRGVVSLGAPKFFQRKSHIFFPAALWLNHISKIFRFRQVPVQEISKVVTELPVCRQLTRFISNHNIGDLNFLISPENHKQDKYFVERYLKIATESIPLGLGFQCLKAIYDGNGFRRMDDSRLNYSACLPWFPEDIPVVHFWGTRDPLVPITNLKYRKHYPHRTKKIYRLQSPDDLKKVHFSADRSQLIDFVVDGANHIDLLYGKIAEQIVKPLLAQVIREIWGDWSYDAKFAKAS